MGKRFKPMLASTEPVDPDELEYPLYASPKLDGVRAVIKDGEVKQRSLKPVRNKFIQDELKDLPDGLDGELTVGLNFHKSSGDIRREEGEPDFIYWVFDTFTDPTAAYTDRVRKLNDTPELQAMIGELFMRAYAAVKLDEFEEFNRVISSWEREHLLLQV